MTSETEIVQVKGVLADIETTLQTTCVSLSGGGLVTGVTAVVSLVAVDVSGIADYIGSSLALVLNLIYTLEDIFANVAVVLAVIRNEVGTIDDLLAKLITILLNLKATEVQGLVGTLTQTISETFSGENAALLQQVGFKKVIAVVAV